MTDKQIKIRIEAETNKAAVEIKKLNNDIDRLNRQVQTSGKSRKSVDQLTRSFKQLAIHVGKLMVIYGSAKGMLSAITMMKDMEVALADVSKTTNLAGDELERFDKDLQNLSKELQGVKYTELLDIAAAAGQLGVQGRDDLLTFTEAVAKVGVATEFTADEAAVAFGRLANATETPITEVENLASSVNELSNTTAATVKEIVNVSLKMAGTATTFGLTSGEINGVSATLKSLGVTTEVAGSSFKKILLKMLSDTKEFAKLSGVSFEEFSDMIKNDPTEAIFVFLEAMEGVENTEVGAALEKVGLTGGEVSDVVLKLAGNMDKLRTNIDTGTKAYEENISIQNEFAIRSATFQAAMDSFNSSIEIMVKNLGMDMLEALTKGTKELTEFINSADPATIEAFSQALGGVTEAVMDMVIILAKAIGSVVAFSAEHRALVATLLEVGTIAAVLYKYRAALTAVYGAKAVLDMAKYAGGVAKVTAAIKAMNLAAIAAGGAFALLGVVIVALLYKYNEMLEYIDKVNEGTEKLNQLTKDSATVLERATKAINDYREGIKQTEEQRNSMLLQLGEEMQLLEDHIKVLEAQKNPTKEANQELWSLKQTYGNLQTAVDMLLEQDLGKDLEKEAAAAKKANDAQKELKDAYVETSNARLVAQRNVLDKLYSQEQGHVNEILKLQKEAYEIERTYANKRLELSDRHNQVLFDANQKGLNDYQQYQNSRARVDDLIRKGRMAAETGNLDQAKKYYDDALSLAEGFAGETIEIEKEIMVRNKETGKMEKETVTDVMATKSQTLAEYNRKYAEIHKGQIELIYQQEQAEIEANISAMKLAEIELQSTKAQIQAQMALINAIKEKQRSISDSEYKLDEDGLKESIKNIDKMIADSKAAQKGLQVKADLSTEKFKQDMLEADLAIEKVVSKKRESVTLELQVDTTPASNDHAAWIEWAANKKARAKLELDNEEATEKVEEVVQVAERSNPETTLSVDTRPAAADVQRFDNDTARVEPETKEMFVDMNAAYVGVNEFTAFVAQQHPYITAYVDANPAYIALTELVSWANSLVTSHTHTIYARRVGFADGGHVDNLPGFADGGHLRRIGKIPGHDTSGKDDVKAMLTRGEFVLPVSAVDHYGLDMLEAMRFKALPKFATGGLIDNIGEVELFELIKKYVDAGVAEDDVIDEIIKSVQTMSGTSTGISSGFPTPINWDRDIGMPSNFFAPFSFADGGKVGQSISQPPSDVNRPSREVMVNFKGHNGEDMQAFTNEAMGDALEHYFKRL